MPNHEREPAADLFTEVGRALTGNAENWQMHLSDWLQVRRDTIRDWRSGRMEPRPEVWDELLALLVERQAAMKEVETKLRAWLAQQPEEDRT